MEPFIFVFIFSCSDHTTPIWFVSFFVSYSILFWPSCHMSCFVPYTHSILTIRHLFLFLSDSSCPSFHLSDMTVYPAPLLKLMMHDVYNTYIATGCSLKSFGCVCACMCQVCVCICFACVCMLSVRVCPSPSLHLKG